MRVLTDDLIIDRRTRQATRDGQPLAMTPLTFDLLQCLVKAAPDIATTESIMAEVWPDTVVSDETLTQRVSLLRKALASGAGDGPRYIESVRNRGYRWIPPVHEDVPQSPGPEAWPRVVRGLGLAGVFSALAVGIWWWSGPASNERPDGGSDPLYAESVESGQRYHRRFTADGSRLAEAMFRQALAVDGEGLRALTGLSVTLSQQVTKFNANPDLLDEALELAQLAIAQDGDDAKAWAAFAYAYDAMGRIDTAIRGYERALGLAPDSISVQSSLSYLYGKKGRLADALRMNLATPVGPQEYAELQRAELWYLLGELERAEPLYFRSDRTAPDSVFAASGHAKFLFGLKRFDDAEQVLWRAIDDGVERPELWELLGELAILRGDEDQARTHFEKASALEHRGSGPQAWLTWLDRSQPQAPEQSPPWTTTAADVWPDLLVTQAIHQVADGDADAALHSLDLGRQAGFRDWRYLLATPAFDGLQQRSEFAELIAAMQAAIERERRAVAQLVPLL